MPTDVIMPQMGESIFEGTITKWLKKPGDKVQRDEPLFEISTDKVDAEIPAPAAGILKEIKVAEGATVQVNTVVGIIDAEGSAVTAPSAPTSAASSVPAKSAAPAPAAPAPAKTAAQASGASAPQQQPPATGKAAPASASGNGGGASQGGAGVDVVMPQMGES